MKRSHADLFRTLCDSITFETAVEQARAEFGMANAAVLQANVDAKEAAAELDRRNSLLKHDAGSLVDRNKAEAVKQWRTRNRLKHSRWYSAPKRR